VLLERLGDDLERRRGGYSVWARWVLHVAARASFAGHPADALRLVLRLDPNRLGSLRAMHAQYIASFHVTLGDRSAARAVLAEERPYR
jgi:hypothetical protein